MSMHDYKFVIGGTGPSPVQEVDGDYFQVITANGDITISFDESESITRRQGMGGPIIYRKVRVGASTPQMVVLSLGKAGNLPPYDARQNVSVLGATAQIVPADFNPASPKVTIAAGAGALVAPANVKRLELRLRLLSTAANQILWGDNAVAATTGNPLEPGDTEYVNTRAAVYAFNPGAAPIDIYFGELNTP